MLRAVLIATILLLPKLSLAVTCEDASYLRDLVDQNCTVNSQMCDGVLHPDISLGSYSVEWQLDAGSGDLIPRCRAISCNGDWMPWGDKAFSSSIRIPGNCIDNPPTPPDIKKITNDNNDPKCRAGSIIQTSNQVIGETIPLVGVSFYLSHFSSRVIGRIGDYSTKFSVTGFTSKITGIDILVKDEYQNVLTSQHFTSDQVYTYKWNGSGADGKETWSSVKREITYKTISGISVSDQNYQLVLGSLKAKKLGFGGWLPSIWHFYDSIAEKIYDGDGNARKVKAVKEGIYNRVASADGSEVYYFDSIGRITLTRTGLTGALLYSFGYDETTEKILNITDAFNKITRFKYDSNGNISQIISSENIKTNFTVDQNGYLKTVTNPKNETYSMVYKDAGGLLASFTKPTGNVSTFTYDENGNLLTDVNSSGQSSTLTKTENGVNAVSAIGRLTQNSYNASTNTEVEIRPSGLTTTYVNTPEQTSVSNVVRVTKSNITQDPRFGDQVLNYSHTETTNFGTTVTNVENTVNLSDLTNPFAVSTLTKTIIEGPSEITSQYDGITRTKTYISKLGRSISTQLDALERPILRQIGTHAPKKYIYQNDLLTKILQGEKEYNFTYDPSTKLLSKITNSLNQSVEFSYDEAQRLKSKRLTDGRVIQYQYDSNNNLVNITPPGRPAHKQIYGANELLSSYNPPALSGVNNANTVYTYNKDKDLIKITRPDGEVINFNYNQTTGLLDSLAGNFGTITREYQNELLTKITGHGQTIQFGYTGNVVSSLTAPNYQYTRIPSTEAQGLVGSETVKTNIKSQTIDYHYDDDKFLTQAGNFHLTYNSPNGQLVQTSLDNIKETYEYDKNGDVKSYRSKLVQQGQEKILYSYFLKRDKLGRIIEKLEYFKGETNPHHNGHLKNRNNNDKLLSQYVYDQAGRLTHVHGFRRNSNYEYDENSNRIHGHAGDEEFNAIYDNQDRLIRMNNFLYSYNANGDLISKSEKVKSTYQNTNYVYDVFGNLKQVGNVTYKIDPLQRRSARLVNGVVTNKYIYNPEGQLIGELDSEDNLLKTFVYASKNHVPDYFIDQNNNRFKILVDQLGSVRLVVNTATGEVVEKMHHDEFGKVLEDSNPNFIPFGFAGGIYDSESKLVRFGLRDYDSQIGRWTSKDSIRFDGEDSNLYGYVFQNPVNFIDPTGKFWYIPDWMNRLIWDWIEKQVCKMYDNCPKDPTPPPPPQSPDNNQCSIGTGK